MDAKEIGGASIFTALIPKFRMKNSINVLLLVGMLVFANAACFTKADSHRATDIVWGTDGKIYALIEGESDSPHEIWTLDESDSSSEIIQSEEWQDERCNIHRSGVALTIAKGGGVSISEICHSPGSGESTRASFLGGPNNELSVRESDGTDISAESPDSYLTTTQNCEYFHQFLNGELVGRLHITELMPPNYDDYTSQSDLSCNNMFLPVKTQNKYWYSVRVKEGNPAQNWICNIADFHHESEPECILMQGELDFNRISVDDNGKYAAATDLSADHRSKIAIIELDSGEYVRTEFEANGAAAISQDGTKIAFLEQDDNDLVIEEIY